MGQPPRVLLINSDAGILLETTARLQEKGIEVAAAWTFQQVHEVMAGRPPDVIVIEPVLDGIDGFELCRAIRKVYKDPSAPIVIASNKVRGEKQRKKAEDVGAYLFLERPAMDERLIEVITQVAPGVGSGEEAPDTTATDRRLAGMFIEEEPAGRPFAFAISGAVVLLAGALVLWLGGVTPWALEVARSGGGRLSLPRDTAPAPITEPSGQAGVPPPSNPGTEAIAASSNQATPPDHGLVETRRVAEPALAEIGDSPGTIAPDRGPPTDSTPARTQADEAAPPPEEPAEPAGPSEPAASIGLGVSATIPRLIAATRVEPPYPALARELQAGGTVVLRALVRADGVPDQIEIVEDSAPQMSFGQAAIEAVRQWRYEPARRNDEPIPWPVLVRFEFEP